MEYQELDATGLSFPDNQSCGLLYQIRLFMNLCGYRILAEKSADEYY